MYEERARWRALSLSTSSKSALNLLFAVVDQEPHLREQASEAQVAVLPGDPGTNPPVRSSPHAKTLTRVRVGVRRRLSLFQQTVTRVRFRLRS
jgi:hypothetical protein